MRNKDRLFGNFLTRLKAPAALLCVALFVLLLGRSLVALAEKAKPPLQLGYRTGEVFTAWGAPTEKTERALKNEVVWDYPGGAFVTFKDGKVVAYRIAGGSIVDVKSETAAVAAQQTIAAAPTAVVAGATRDLVRDIARELPSSPDAPYVDSGPDSSSSSREGGRGMRNPPAPPPPPAPAIIPGDLTDEVDEAE
jgi:hypothetical protein